MKNSINDFMSQDHDRLDDIFKDFVKNREKKLSQTKGLFSEFKQGLEKHIVWEEDILFPLFENKTGSYEGPTHVMLLEHKKIKKILTKILNKLNRNIYITDKLEKQLIEILTDHNGKEEIILYPCIDESLDEKEKKKTINLLK